jgi:signal peptidase I
MLPTLLIGDRVIVNKYAYGISRYSFPFSPHLFSGRILQFSKPNLGDIIVFETDKVYIKRLIGLPGDKIETINGNLYINDKIVPKELSHYPFEYKPGVMLPQYQETLPNGFSHKVLDLSNNSVYDYSGPFFVPDKHYFFMGDNRDNSNDSRNISGPIGFVQEDHILGKVTHTFFSSKEPDWYNIPGIILNLRTDRFFYSLTQ